MYYWDFFQYEVRRLIMTWNSEWKDFSGSFMGKTKGDCYFIIFFCGLLVSMASAMGPILNATLNGAVSSLTYYSYLIGVITLLVMMTLVVCNKNIGSYMWRFASSEIMFMFVWLNMGLCISLWIKHPFFSWFKVVGIFLWLIFMSVLHSQIKNMRGSIKRIIHIGMMMMYGVTGELVLYWDVIPKEFTLEPLKLFLIMVGEYENSSPFKLIILYLFLVYLVIYLPSQISIKDKECK